MKTNQAVLALNLALCAVALSACDPITGTLAVHEEMQFPTQASPTKIAFCESFPKLSMCKDIGPQIIAPGRYQAELSGSSKSVKIKLSNAEGEKNKIKIELPEDIKFPSYSGTVKVAAAELNIAYDLEANVNTVETNGPQREGYESCTWYTQETRCRDVRDEVCKEQNGHVTCTPIIRHECETVNIPHSGTQFVRSHTHYTDKSVNVDFKRPGLEAAIAAFYGEDHKAREVNDYTGECRPDYLHPRF